MILLSFFVTFFLLCSVNPPPPFCTEKEESATVAYCAKKEKKRAKVRVSFSFLPMTVPSLLLRSFPLPTHPIQPELLRILRHSRVGKARRCLQRGSKKARKGREGKPVYVFSFHSPHPTQVTPSSVRNIGCCSEQQLNRRRFVYAGIVLGGFQHLIHYILESLSPCRLLRSVLKSDALASCVDRGRKINAVIKQYPSSLYDGNPCVVLLSQSDPDSCSDTSSDNSNTASKMCRLNSCCCCASLRTGSL